MPRTEKTAESEVDFMADAPKERPYGDAITEEHRAALTEAGVVVPEASQK